MAHSRCLLMPFLYPSLVSFGNSSRVSSKLLNTARIHRRYLYSEVSHGESSSQIPTSSDLLSFNEHLNPPPEDYGRTIFADKCKLSLHAGSGGHGCISFLREKFIAAGPANGGDGGSGGNIYIQAVRGETSLHKLARRGILKAGRGKNGQGSSKGGQRGEDVLIQVPVGTVVREVSRYDPVTEESEKLNMTANSASVESNTHRDKWILYPASDPSEYATAEFPDLPKPRISNLAIMQPPSPISMDLSEPMEQPMLLAAGAVGGLGNPHFVTKSMVRPKFATRGGAGMRLELELELKLLADVGFVGLPNAGKSTLLRALSRSRARIGDWAFTTLQPNIGTVVLDNSYGRPKLHSVDSDGERRTQFSIADIPGLVPDAHLDRGLGLGFLRHIERARVLAFVVDLSIGDSVLALKNLWKELNEFERLKDRATNNETEHRIVSWQAFGSSVSSTSRQDAEIETGKEDMMINAGSQALPPLQMPPISSKPWFVVGTKADLPSSQENYAHLKTYLESVSAGKEALPSGKKHGWKGQLMVIPISAIRGEGIDQITEWTISLLNL
ncbi:GTPase of the mitochondrial inner membrane that associates with the large ribosomal subunit [Xylographa parallela]|nr:GTPase of the mitochondrial inner membrane that associates with the large ribosomal subunit [Xylographa parallela]